MISDGFSVHLNVLLLSCSCVVLTPSPSILSSTRKRVWLPFVSCQFFFCSDFTLRLLIRKTEGDHDPLFHQSPRFPVTTDSFRSSSSLFLIQWSSRIKRRQTLFLSVIKTKQEVNLTGYPLREPLIQSRCSFFSDTRSGTSFGPANLVIVVGVVFDQKRKCFWCIREKSQLLHALLIGWLSSILLNHEFVIKFRAFLINRLFELTLLFRKFTSC
jgi:hypothetical protein